MVWEAWSHRPTPSLRQRDVAGQAGPLAPPGSDMCHWNREEVHSLIFSKAPIAITKIIIIILPTGVQICDIKIMIFFLVRPFSLIFRAT